MGMKEIKADDMLHTIGERVEEVEILLKGQVRVSNSYGSMILKTGALIGCFETPDEEYVYDYEAVDDVTVYTHEFTSVEDIAKVVQMQGKISPVLASSSVKTALDLYSWYEKLHTETEARYHSVKSDFDSYPALTIQTGQEAKEYPEVQSLAAPPEKEGLEGWRMTYLNSLMENDALVRKGFYAISPDLCIGTVMRMSEFDTTVSSQIMELAEYREKLEEAVGDFEFDFRFLKSRTEQAGAAAGGEEVTKEITGAMDIILGYAGSNAETSRNMHQLVDQFIAAPDKNDTSDEMRKLRKELARDFYKIYTDVYMKTLEDPTPPPEVRMFLMFGFLDERLVGKEDTAKLYNLMLHWRPDPNNHVFTVPEWLRRIYEMKENPSKNEFDADYPEYLREQVQSGNITKAQAAELQNDRKERVKFEIENLLAMGNRVTYGRITTFIPQFNSEEIIRPLDQTLLTKDKLMQAIDKLREIDFSCFYRETFRNYADLEINQFIKNVEVLPNIILMPNMGSRTLMWQEIDGKKRDTPARMLMPIFFTEDLDEAIVKLCGEYRWEMCRRIQGVHWNDVTDPSLTSEYCDYLQFYKKNHELSPDTREKIKTALQKARNNYRGVFIQDYNMYIRNEASGSARMNKVARGIVYRYCPFPKALRDKMHENPQYADIIDKWKVKQSGKAKLVQVAIKKVENLGKEVPAEMTEELDYLLR
ncbi:hypothetical protein SAMN06296386_101329 [Lachnospiraceae bacterium]|nr:hypothetical protein SAMN06296386_101329 [Lachnospiraceae bacterium]